MSINPGQNADEAISPAKPYFDIVFISPLREELDALCSQFVVEKDRIEGVNYIAELRLGKAGVSGLVILQDAMGKAAATRAADLVIGSYDIGIIVVFGIAGGISDDVAIGDVCFTGSIVDVLENAKVSDSKHGPEIELDPEYHNTDARLTFALKCLSLMKAQRSDFEDWQERCYYHSARLIPGEFIGRSNRNEVVSIPQAYDGTLVCGSVSKSEVYKATLKGIDRKPLALETESGGPFRSAQTSGNIPVVTIRAVCDYADNNKAKFEEATLGAGRRIATHNVVTYIAAQLKNPAFLRYLEDRKQPIFETSSGGLFAETPISRALRVTDDIVDFQLRELSPEYRLKPRGYRLPLPRVRLSDKDAASSNRLRRGAPTTPISPLEAIVANPISVFELPPAYPDKSLAWMLARELSLIQIEGRQAVPVVVNGEHLSPPVNGFQESSSLGLQGLADSGDVELVFIVEKLPWASKARASFLLNQLAAYPHSRAVILNPEISTPAQQSELVIRGRAKTYALLDISFGEMAAFLSRNYEIPDQEAGVVALKLRDAFAKFDLSAHPSYFASIAADSISALLHANRRAELIQLATDGFLSFVVASDKQPVRLSRTTRARFLRALVYEIKVNVKTFTQSSLVEFVSEFSALNDYDIDAFAFVNGFVQNGILHFENGHVGFTLPFMESYLLAIELVGRPADASTYFALNGTDFDFSSFDLYSELGPGEAIVSDAISALKGELTRLKALASREHVLLSDEIRPAAVEKPNRLREVEARLQKASIDIAENRSNVIEKQKLLDMAEWIRYEISNAESGDLDPETEAALKELEFGFELWFIGTTLIGSAAEHLSAGIKRELSQVLVGMTSVLLDLWMRAFPRKSFENFREKLGSDDAITKMYEVLPEAITDDLRIVVQAIIDSFENSLLGYPIHMMLGHLGNTAGQAVLGKTIANVADGSKMENLITAIWASKISAADNKAKLLRAIRDLPPTPFLRIQISSHFEARVFWNHWERTNRLALIDAAVEAIEPLGGRNLDRAKLQRFVEDNSSAR